MSDEMDQDRDLYLRAVRLVVGQFETLLGKETARKYARKAPLEINPDGTIESLYGKGEDAFELVVEQYKNVWGEKVAMRKVRDTLSEELDEEELQKMPEKYRKESSGASLVDTVLQKITG